MHSQQTLTAPFIWPNLDFKDLKQVFLLYQQKPRKILTSIENILSESLKRSLE
jgi:hypothetical protein